MRSSTTAIGRLAPISHTDEEGVEVIQNDLY